MGGGGVFSCLFLFFFFVGVIIGRALRHSLNLPWAACAVYILIKAGMVALSICEPVWPSGKALARLVSRGTSVRIRFGSPFSSKAVVCGHCLVTLFLTMNETLKWLSSPPILRQESFWW